MREIVEVNHITPPLAQVTRYLPDIADLVEGRGDKRTSWVAEADSVNKAQRSEPSIQPSRYASDLDAVVQLFDVRFLPKPPPVANHIAAAARKVAGNLVRQDADRVGG